MVLPLRPCKVSPTLRTTHSQIPPTIRLYPYPSTLPCTHPHPRPQAVEELRDTLVQHAARLADLFRQWDHWNVQGSDGTVSKSAFRRAMVNVGLCVPRMAV